MSNAKTKSLTGTLFIIALALSVLLVIYLRKADNGVFTPSSTSYRSEADLADAETQLDSAALDSPTADEQALEADLSF